MTILYCATCIPNGKLYVGITDSSLSNRWAQHIADAARGSPHKFQRAVAKHGPYAFRIEALWTYLTRAEAEHAEIELIHHLNLQRHGYNTSAGGDLSPMAGRQHSSKSKKKMSARATGRKATPEIREAMSQRRKGRKHSAEHVAKIAAANRGKKRTPEQIARIAKGSRDRNYHHDAETRKRIGEASAARIRSEETRARQSASMKAAWLKRKAK